MGEEQGAHLVGSVLPDGERVCVCWDRGERAHHMPANMHTATVSAWEGVWPKGDNIWVCVLAALVRHVCPYSHCPPPYLAVLRAHHHRVAHFQGAPLHHHCGGGAWGGGGGGGEVERVEG